MKKFDHLIAFTLIFLISTVVLVTGCGKTDTQSKQESMVYEPESNTRYDINDPSQLRSLVKKVADEDGEIEILKAIVQEITDQKGNTFKAIVSKYRLGDDLTNMVTPLISKEIPLAQTAKGSVTTYLVAPCEMKCTSAWGCTECTQTIIEQCKSQKCNCTSGNGGCSSKIIFPE